MSARRHVVLVGLSGSGKSTVGPLLAARLGRRFVDTDDLIEAEAGATIPQIFAERGEAAFRAIEETAGARAVGGAPAVIATGGGAPVGQRNRELLWERNLVVWLDADVATLARRVERGGPDRPLLRAPAGPDVRLRELLAARGHIYAQAHLHVRTDTLSPDAVVEQIARRILEESK